MPEEPSASLVDRGRSFAPYDTPMKPILLAVALAITASCICTKHEAPTPTNGTASNASHGVIYKTIPLKYASAGELAATLRGVVVTSSGGPAPQIVADQRTN